MYPLFKLFVFLLIILTAVVQASNAAPLKALLYCYLPTFDLKNPMPELNNLKNLVNRKLAEKGINVEVDICDPNDNLLYESEINEYFNSYDILEIDMLALSRINVPLLKFTTEDVKDYYHDIFPFQWDSLARVEDGQTYFLGSPGITCSDFFQKRSGSYQDVLHVVGGVDKYKFVSFYAGLYLNKYPEKTLATLDYSKVQDDLIADLANLLVRCQEDKTKFDYSQVTCINVDYNTYPASIYHTASQETLGFSQNLYRFFADRVVESTAAQKEASSIKVQHLLGSAPKKIIYVDQFIAKQTDDDQASGRKQTILQFNKFMISDQVLQIYAKGMYLSNRHNDQFTYLIPPTISFFDKLKAQDQLYQQIYQALFNGATLSPIYQKEYADNLRGLYSLIDSALIKYSQSLASQSIVVDMTL